MNAWPMLERCLGNQWAGYTPRERDAIRTAWEDGTAPGLVGGLAHRVYGLWELIGFPPHQRYLISVKEECLWDEILWTLFNDPAR